MLTLSRIDCVYARISVEAALADGTPAVLTHIDVALLPPGSTPDADTVWTSVSVVDGVASVLLAAPDADDPGDALLVPTAGVDLWLRVVDNPETQAVKVGRVKAR